MLGLDLVKLDEEAQLRRIDGDMRSRDEFQKMVGKMFFGENFRHFLVWNVFCVLETRTPNVEDYSRIMLLALRLLKAGDVRGPVAFQLKGDRERHLTSAPFDTNILSNNTYCLNEEEIADFKAIWNKCRQSLASKFNLDYPISKFMEAYEKNKPDERILDCIIAFESLIFHNRDQAIEPSGEVIGIAIGMLLGNTQKERDEIKKKLMDAYKVRNAKVHGNIKQLEKYRKGMDQLSVKVEEYLRCTLRRFVEEEVG